MQLRFLIADVFAEQPFGGNQLAVFPDAPPSLSDRAMQALALEFNFPETTFVLPTSDPRCTRRIRIFTPRSELPFAGHPTVGTAAVLAHTGALDGSKDVGEMVFEEGVGPVGVTVRRQAGALFSELALEQSVEIPDRRPDPAVVARMLSLDASSVVDTWFGSLGVRFAYAQLDSREAVDRAVLDRAAWSNGLAKQWAPQLFFFAGPLRAGAHLYARMFAPGLGIEEDPATGSASAILVGILGARDASALETLSLQIEQGVAMGRPSRIHARAEKREGRVRRLCVGGTCAIVAEGAFTVPDGY